jgi:hypothetical protein
MDSDDKRLFQKFSLNHIDEIPAVTPSFLSMDSGMMSFIQDDSQIDKNDSLTPCKYQKKENNDTVIIHRYIRKEKTNDDGISKEEMLFNINSSTLSNSHSSNKRKQININSHKTRGVLKSKINTNIDKKTNEILRKNFAHMNFIEKDLLMLTKNKNNDNNISNKNSSITEEDLENVEEEVDKINRVKDFQRKYLEKNKSDTVYHKNIVKLNKYLTFNPRKSFDPINDHLVSLVKYNLKSAVSK